MNKLTRLTALLLAMLMIFSTFATAETAYQVGGMTVENWQGIVDSAADKLFTIDEGDSGKVVTPPPTVTPAPGAFYPYTDVVSVDLGAATVENPLQITASGVAVLKNAEAGQWQMQYGNTWINITGATDSELWATSAMMNGMSVANFRKAFGERNAETGEYASYTNVATVEIVAEVAGAMFMMSRAAEDEGAVTPTPAPVTAANDVMTIEDANPDLVKYAVTINYKLASDTSVLWEPFIAQVGEYNPTLNRTVKYPDIVGYKPGTAKLVTSSTSETETLPDGFVHSSENKTMTINATISGDLTINVYYVPAEVNYTVKYYQEKISYPAAATTDEKYDLIASETKSGYTESTIAEDIEADGNDATDVNGVQFYAPKDKYPGFLPLLYDDSQKIAAAGNTEVKVRYQRLYYLLSFNLGGGYGVDPVYDKFGATVDPVGTPTRAGYTFKGWTLDKDATVYVAGSYDESKLIQETDEAFPKTVPAENRIYYAVWEAQKVAYTVVYWRENANNNDYSFWGSQKFDAQNEMVLAGSTLNYDESKHAIPSSITTVTINGDTVNESNYFTFNAALTDKDVPVEGDGTTILNVYYYRKTYTVYFDANGTMTGACVIEPHNHNDGTCTQDLICHIHGEDCVKTLTCTIEAGHVHSAEECGTILKCGETVHTTHTRACYEGTANSPTADPRGTEPSNPVEGQVHVGRDSNYQSDRKYVYTNGAWYRLDDNINVQNGDILTPGCHQHSESCYTFNCNKVENHKHVDSCYAYTCPEADHVHTSACYRPCTKPVHTHSTACNNASGDSNVRYVITAKYNQDINWPAFDGIAYWTGNSAYDNDSLTQSSKVVTLTHDYANANTMTMQAHTGTTSYALNYMFESFDQTSGEDTYKRRSHSNLYYDRSERYSQIAHYGTTSSWSYKVIDGFTRAQTGSASVANNTYSDLDADKIVFLYYKRNRWTLSFYNHSSDAAPQLSNDQVMFDQPLDGYVIDGKNLNTYLPADNYYPKDLEVGAYYFDGWYTTPECFDGTEFDPETAFMPNGDLNVYGKWSPYEYTVTVYNTPEDAAAGTPVLYEFKNVEHGKSTSSVFSYDNPNHYDQETGKFKEPVSPGNGEWQFVGWFYMKDGEETAFSFLDTRITQDTVVYAKWQMNKVVKYKVYYVLDNGDDTEGSYNIAKKNWVAALTEDSNLAGSDITVPALGGTNLYDATKSPTGINYQEGYFPKVSSQDIYIDLDETANVFVFEYVQVDAKPYTVYYLTEENPNNNLGTETIDGKTYYKVAETLTKPENRKAVVTENYAPVSGNYLPDAFQKRLVITADSSDEDNVIFFWYTKDLKHTTLEINHYTVDYDGKTTQVDIRQEIIELPYNETVVPLTIDHYQYKAELTTRTEGGVAVSTDSPLVLNLPEGTPGVVLNLYYVEDPVTITYKVATESLNMGTVVVGAGEPGNEANETIGVLSGNAQGATAAAATNYEFVGWYSEDACETLVSSDPKYVPSKANGLNVEATYYALFREVTTMIHYIPVGPDNHELTAEEKLTIGDVNPPSEVVSVVTGEAQGSTAAAKTTKYRFDGWYSNAACTQKVGDDEFFKPTKGTDKIWDATNTTYYAKFVYDVGHLSITKTVVNTTTDFTPTQTTFTFTVKLTGVTGDVKYWIGETEYTATKIKDGEYNLTLANGQMAMIKNILNGTKYTVTETPVTGYTTTYLKNEKQVEGYEVSGTIIPGATVNEIFINTYAVGSLELTKTVEGTVTDAYPSNFGFTLTLSDAAALANCKIQINDGTVNAMPQDGKFTLEHGQKAIITGIPQGVTYTVTEDAQVNGKNVADYFTVTAVGEKVNGNVVTGMIAADTTDKADFTNTAKTGRLTITKNIFGDGASVGDTFLFNVTGPKGYKTTVVLTGGQSVTLSELYFGQYTVTENTAWSWRYTISGQKSQICDVVPGTVPAADFTNERTENKWLDGEVTDDNTFN